MHRTSEGQVVYYRCYCDHVQILVAEARSDFRVHSAG